MLIEIAAEIVARVHPNDSSSGTISTLGVARTPAATRRLKNVSPATIHAYSTRRAIVLGSDVIGLLQTRVVGRGRTFCRFAISGQAECEADAACPSCADPS